MIESPAKKTNSLSLRFDMASAEVVLSNPAAEQVFVHLNDLIYEVLDVEDSTAR